jgi:hypothetical protein
VDFTALFIIVIGLVLVVVGWRGTYAKIWSGFSNITPASSTPTTTPSSTGIPTGAPGQGQIP